MKFCSRRIIRMAHGIERCRLGGKTRRRLVRGKSKVLSLKAKVRGREPTRAEEC